MQTASRPPLRRIMAIDQMIRSGEYPNATTAARQLEVHPRTIHRDLEFLRDSLRMPLEFSRATTATITRSKPVSCPSIV